MVPLLLRCTPRRCLKAMVIHHRQCRRDSKHKGGEVWLVASSRIEVEFEVGDWFRGHAGLSSP